MQVRHRRPPRFGRPRPLQASRPRYQRPCRYEGSDRGRPFASFMADDVAGPDATRHPNRMICGQRLGKHCHSPAQLRGSSRLGDGSVALECDRSCVVTSRAFSFDRGGAAAMIALFAVGFLAACGGGNGSAGGTLTSGGTRTTPTRSTPSVTAPTRSTPTVTAPTRSTPTVTAPTRSTATVTESQTTTVVAVTPPPATTTTTGATTTSGGVSPAAAAAAAAAAASAGRRIEQHAVGLDRIRNSRGGGPHRRDRLVVAETLRPCEHEDAGARRSAGRPLVCPT